MIPAGADNHLVAGDFSGTWRDLPGIELPSAVASFVGSNTDALRVVWHHATQQPQETLVASAGRKEPGLVQALKDQGLTIADVATDGVSIDAPGVDHDPIPERVWLLTSGSTGRPKHVGHTLESLTTVKGEQPPRTWLCPYTPGAYAWWQVVTLGLSKPNQNLVFVDNSRMEEWPQFALDHGVNAASGTPTFWRQALMRSGEVLSKVGLRQITLGGEPVDQAVLDLLTEAFPDARVSWVYASSEAGASIAVHDGKAGFPEAWLTKRSVNRPALSIREGELVIASPHRGEGVEAELRTGDRAETRDSRVLITGRLASDEINVGGSKVSASQVRDVLQSHPGVIWAAVKGRRAPVVGTVVQADVVLAAGSTTETELAQYCTERLADYAVPRRFRFLDSIPLKESLKSHV